MLKKLYKKFLHMRYKWAVERAMFAEECRAWDKVDRLSKKIDEAGK